MAGEIQEPFRLNFQADLLHSGSISFGRFESESLSWERRSIFSHNRYLEEVEKYSKPGSVTEKKAYFEAEFRRKRLLKQTSSESQDGGEFPTSRNSGSESPCSSDPSEYNKETQIQHHEKGDVEASLYDENDNGGMRVACFDESPHNSGCDEDTVSQECESQNCKFLPVVKMIDCPVSVPDHVKIDETHKSVHENVEGNNEEIVVDVASEANDSSLTRQTLEKDDDNTSTGVTGPMRTSSPKVKHASEKKLTRATLKPQANSDRFQKRVSNEPSKGSMKPRTSESKGLLVKKTEKKSPRPASPLPCSGVKSSKSEVTRSEKDIKTRSSILKKSLPAINRPKQTISSSKSHVIQSTAGFSLKTDRRAETRKEFYMKFAEKMHAKEAEINQVEAKTMEKQAVEIKQFRRSLNFKATTMPSFYNGSNRGSDQRKVTPNPPRPRSQSVTKNAVKSSVPSDIRPGSSTNKIRVSESVGKSRVPEKKEQEKKKDTSIMKQKKPDLRGHKSGHIAVGVAS